MSTLIAALLISGAAPRVAPKPFDPVSAYDRREIAGFTVLVNRKVLAHEHEAKEVLGEVDSQLANIVTVLPPKHLKALRKIRIWIEWDAKPRGGAEFHVSAGYLRNNGYNPEKVHGIEISNTRNFVAWARKTQPWCVMHELAHAYHFTEMGARHEGLLAAYRQAIDRKLYDSVKHVQGRTEKAYAATNEAEYFAELTEAYLGKNDFAPFTRGELERHDPVGYKLMETIWGSR